MRKTLIATAALAALLTLPNLASADPNAAGGAATGAAVGAGTGFIIGGPVGAAVGAGVGGTVGAASSPSTRNEVIIERPARSTTERDCVRDSAGNVACREIRR